jgi:hypothetical protein
MGGLVAIIHRVFLGDPPGSEGGRGDGTTGSVWFLFRSNSLDVFPIAMIDELSQDGEGVSVRERVARIFSVCLALEKGGLLIAVTRPYDASSAMCESETP